MLFKLKINSKGKSPRIKILVNLILIAVNPAKLTTRRNLFEIKSPPSSFFWKIYIRDMKISAETAPATSKILRLENGVRVVLKTKKKAKIIANLGLKYFLVDPTQR